MSYPRIGVFCHMYHPHLFKLFHRHLSNIPEPSDLYFSTSSKWKAMRLMWMFWSWPGEVTIKVVPNRGRDIAPKLITFGPHHSRYDLVLHIHTKHRIPDWRDYLLAHLLGSRYLVAKIIDHFEKHPKLGILAAEHYPPIAKWCDWRFNKEHADKLAARMAIDINSRSLEFPSSSMFWARPAALSPLLNLGLRFSDFPEEPLPKDGTIAHAIERLFFYSAEHAGYEWHYFSIAGGQIVHRGRQPSAHLS